MLHFEWNPLELENISPIANFSELRSLSLKTTRRSEDISRFLPILNDLAKLKSLVFDNCSLPRIKDITQYKDVFSRLTKLHFDDCCYVPMYPVLTAILRICLVCVDLKLPLIEREDLSCSEVLDCVAELQFLRSLDFSTTYYTLTGNFDTCLMKIGSRLRVLNLSSCRKVNLWLVRKHCENIEELYSTGRTFYIIPESSDRLQLLKQNFCPKLKVFHIELFVSRTVTHNLSSDIELNDALKEMMFLDSPVSNLKLRECNLEFMESILNEMRDNYLERLEIVWCFGVITIEHVMKILMKFVNLKYFAIKYYYETLSKDEKKRIDHFLKKSKKDVTVNIFW